MTEKLSRLEKAKQTLDRSRTVRNRLAASGVGLIAIETMLQASDISKNGIPDSLVGIAGGLTLVLAIRGQTDVRNAEQKINFYNDNPLLGELPEVDDPYNMQ